MGFIKFIVWTTFAVGFGIYISSAKYDNGTPLQQLERLWKHHGPSEAEVREKVGGALESAKGAVAAKTPPTEKILPEDRDAVNKLIAKRGSAK